MLLALKSSGKIGYDNFLYIFTVFSETGFSELSIMPFLIRVLTNYLLIDAIVHMYDVCGACTTYGACVEVRGQFGGAVLSFYLHEVPRIELRLSELYSKHIFCLFCFSNTL